MNDPGLPSGSGSKPRVICPGWRFVYILYTSALAAKTGGWGFAGSNSTTRRIAEMPGTCSPLPSAVIDISDDLKGFSSNQKQGITGNATG
jgi:hypothetical protein